MPRPRIKIVPHLEYAELTRRYCRCRNGAKRTRWLVICLLSRPGNPVKVEQVAEITDLSAAWVRRIVRRYNEKSPLGLVDGHEGVLKVLLANPHLIDVGLLEIMVEAAEVYVNRMIRTPQLVCTVNDDG